jgi:hypothetical protein
MDVIKGWFDPKPVGPKPIWVRIHDMSEVLVPDTEIRRTLLELKETPGYSDAKYGSYVRRVWNLTKPLERDEPYVPSYERSDQKRKGLKDLLDAYIIQS